MSLALYSAFVGSSIQGCATAWSDAYRAVAAADNMLKLLLEPPPPLMASPLNYPGELSRFQEALRRQQQQQQEQQQQPQQEQQQQQAAIAATAAACGTATAGHRGLSVEFRDVWFSYPLRQNHWALRGLSFKVPPGAVVAITGIVPFSPLWCLLETLMAPAFNLMHVIIAQALIFPAFDV